MEPLEDHALIGDGRTAALVSRRGAIDWLCWPRFDSPALFAGILDDAAGSWRIAPSATFRSRRRYLEGTNVLETTFETSGGTAVLTDLMPAATEEDKRRALRPDHWILRQIEVERGEVELEMVFEPRPDFGAKSARLRLRGALGLRVETRSGLLVLQTDLGELGVGDGQARARVRLRAGDVRHASLTFHEDAIAVYPPLGEHVRAEVAGTVAFWRKWSSAMTYRGPGREAVLRSVLALKLLGFAPSGAIVAAPTTSLPERIGGDLNWDYRFCWLRDASLTIRALFGLGFVDEGMAFLSWMLHSTWLTSPELSVLLDVYGKKPARERTLSLSGYQGSRPVRIGNAAMDQLQLDIHGEVLDAAALFVRRGGRLDRQSQRMLEAFADHVCRSWRQPDEGIWEPRTDRVHHTHSRLLCWVALDRMIELCGCGQVQTDRLAEYVRQRQLIREDIEQHAFNSRLGCYTATLGGDDVDASLLLLARHGFEPATSPRMRRTFALIEEKLGAGGGLLYRYRSPDSPGEGAFGICGFWGVEHLAIGGGTAEEARALFDRVLSYANDVGLFGEEIDPGSFRPLGNFPQGFTHVGLINAALSLAARLEQERP